MMNDFRSSLAPLRELRLRLDSLVELDEPRVTVLIDGAPVWQSTRPGFQGFPVSELLASDAPLVAGAVPSRVAVGMCGCGVPGCGSLAPIIERLANGNVRWSDFREFTGVFEEPLASSPVRSIGRPTPFGDVEFDGVQYDSEVARFMTDRSWESPEQTTARLLFEMLTLDRERIVAEGLVVESILARRGVDGEPVWVVETRELAPRDPGLRPQQYFSAPTSACEHPHDRAADLYRQLRSVEVRQWPVSFPRRRIGSPTA